jgi:tripartite-type tricarboxylate transporter receptor subunit TctC
LNAEIKKVLALPEVGERLAGDGAEPVGGSPEQFHQLIAAEITKWRKVVDEAGIRAE